MIITLLQACLPGWVILMVSTQWWKYSLASVNLLRLWKSEDKKAAPKRILTDHEGKKFQTLIIGLRWELDLIKKRPEEIFKKFRRANKAQASIPKINFLLTVTETPEFEESGSMMIFKDGRLLFFTFSRKSQDKSPQMKSKSTIRCLKTNEDYHALKGHLARPLLV